jgi:hypothetical protein
VILLHFSATNEWRKGVRYTVRKREKKVARIPTMNKLTACFGTAYIRID